MVDKNNEFNTEAQPDLKTNQDTTVSKTELLINLINKFNQDSAAETLKKELEEHGPEILNAVNQIINGELNTTASAIQDKILVVKALYKHGIITKEDFDLTSDLLRKKLSEAEGLAQATNESIQNEVGAETDKESKEIINKAKEERLKLFDQLELFDKTIMSFVDSLIEKNIKNSHVKNMAKHLTRELIKFIPVYGDKNRIRDIKTGFADSRKLSLLEKITGGLGMILGAAVWVEEMRGHHLNAATLELTSLALESSGSISGFAQNAIQALALPEKFKNALSALSNLVSQNPQTETMYTAVLNNSYQSLKKATV